MNSENTGFDPAVFLAHSGLGRRIVQLKPKEAFFSQGNPADSVFYLQKGRAKLTVVSAKGKEATITLLAAGDFCWRGSNGWTDWSSTGYSHGDYSLHDA